MLEKLLPEKIYDVATGGGGRIVTEIRMRVGKPLSVAVAGRYFNPIDEYGHLYEVTREDVDHVLGVATKHSLYAVNSQLAGGYLSCDEGIRIGVSGEGVYKGGRLFTLKNVSSLCIRVPAQIFGCASALERIVKDFGNTVILSPPGYGKTTMLREFVRLLSQSGKNVVVIDERNELSASVNGVSGFDLGPNTDVLLFSSKKGGYADAVRSLRPDLVATDEIFGAEEIDCLEDIFRCGVNVVATVHAKNTLSLLENKVYGRLAKFTRYFVELGELGKVTKIIDKEVIKKC